jgi:eukaryotic-like serine/threonine-protein kinase
VRSTTRKTITATVVAERYRLEGELARGGMGTVWLARDVKLGRRVAIKVLAQELAQMSEAQQRFEREAQALAQLRSTHIVEVYDFGVQEGLPFIVMELLEGENLGQRLKRIGCLGVEDATVVVYQMCKGLKAAHAAGLIHRDLKPSNIFLARRDDVEVVKLLDFGVVKAMDTIGQTDATVSGMLLGTPQYMSPEQARATREIDHRSDLWSAAVISFRCLTGQNPFKGESVGDVVLKICSDALPKITEYRPDLPTSLDEFFERAFARGPDDRFQSASEMADGFQRALAAGWASQRAARSATTSGMNLQSPLSGTPAGGLPAALAPVSQPSFAPETSGSHPAAAYFGNGPPSATAPFPHTPLTSSLAPSTLTPPSFSTGVPMPPPSFDGVVAEPTPVSTTVAGTQLASGAPVRPRPLATQPLTLVVGAAAALITLGLVLAIWFGTSSPSAPAAAATAVPSAQTIPTATPGETDDEAAAEDPVETPPAARAGTNLDEGIRPAGPPPEVRPPEAKSAMPPPKASTAPSATPPPPKKEEKKEKPKEKDKGGRPSWF